MIVYARKPTTHSSVVVLTPFHGTRRRSARKRAPAVAKSTADGAAQLAESSRATFAELLVDLNALRFTGLLAVEYQSVHSHICFIDGTPGFVELGPHELELGRMLLSRGKITARQYSEVIADLTNELIDQEEMRMGECLVRRGIVTVSEVYDLLREQFHAKMMACFSFPSFRYELHHGRDLVDHVSLIDGAEVDKLVLAGVREHFSHADINERLGRHLGQWVRAKESAATLAARFGLSLPEVRFIRAMRGELTLAEHLSTSSDDADWRRTASTLVVTLMLTNCLEFSSASMDHQQRLGSIAN